VNTRLNVLVLSLRDGEDEGDLLPCQWRPADSKDDAGTPSQESRNSNLEHCLWASTTNCSKSGSLGEKSLDIRPVSLL
jgi:hypothetical protein